MHEQLLQVDDEIRSLQEDLQEFWQKAEKAQKQADKYQKRMNELAPMVKNMEKLAADFSADPEQTLPEAAVMESAKSYREKKAKPMVKKIVQIMRSVYSHIWIFQISSQSCKRRITGNGAETSG